MVVRVVVTVVTRHVVHVVAMASAGMSTPLNSSQVVRLRSPLCIVFSGYSL